MIVWAVVGWKNGGKTSLVERLVAEIAARGLTVSTVKNAHHAAHVDRPGTDTDRHREAGACQVILATPARWALMTEAPPPGPEALIARLDPVDVVLLEGFKGAALPKIEAHRTATGQRPLAHDDPRIRLLAADTDHVAPCPVLPLDDTAGILEVLLNGPGDA